MKKNIKTANYLFLIIGMLIIFSYSCKKTKDNNTTPILHVPTLTTNAVINITQSTSSCGGTISSDGGSAIITKGVCWSTGLAPTINDSKTEDGTGIGNFTSNITGLTANTVYYVRAYATNSSGTGYGIAISFTSGQGTNIIPSTFRVTVPSSINSATAFKSTNEIDTLNGSLIYSNLRTYINVGCSASDVVQGIITSIYANNINQAMTFTYASSDDGRTKNVVVIEGASFAGISYQYKLTISDGSTTAFQLFWNIYPIKGVAIMSPYDYNRSLSTLYANTRYQVEYSEAEIAYQKQMIISISNFPQFDIYNTNYINNMKMFVGKNDNLITIIGNTNHPLTTIFDPAQVGKDYAFVAHSYDAINIGVAKVGITPTTLNSTTDIFTTYSVKNVLSDSYYAVYGVPIPSSILLSAEAPAYFVFPQGYISCGTNIPSNAAFTASFTDLSGLTPYIPNDIKNLLISFQ